MLDFILLLFYIAVGSWLTLGGLFFAYPTVYRLKDRMDEFTWIIKVPLAIMLIAGVTADIIFNVWAGSIIYREWPQWELRKKFPFFKTELFTDRMKRHEYGDSQLQKDRGAKWVRWVNMIHAGHV